MSSPKSLVFPLILVLYEIGAYLSTDMYLPAFPQVVTDLHVSAHQAQLTLTMWFVGAVALQLFLGPLSDRYGRRPIILMSGCIYAVTLIICALTTSFPLLLLVRFIQGITVTAALVAGYSSIHEAYDQTHAIRILALMGSIIIIAPAFGPLLGSLVLTFGSWRWIFGLLALWSSVVTVLLFCFMPETNPQENRQPIKLKLLVTNYFAIFSNWQFTGLCFIYCLTFCGFIAWLTAGPFLVMDTFGHSTVIFGIFQALIFACYVAANRLVKTLMESLGIEKLIRMGMSITLLGGLLAGLFAWLLPTTLAGLIIALMIYSFGCGFTSAPINRLSVEASTQPMGLRMAVSSTYTSAFGAIGSVLVSVFYNGTIGSLAYILTIVAILACLTKLSVVKHQTRWTNKSV